MDFLRRISLFCLVLLAAGGQSPLWLHHALFHSACCDTSQDLAVASGHSACGHQHCLSHRASQVASASPAPANWNALAIDEHDCAACYVLSQLNLQSSGVTVAALCGDVAGWVSFQQQVPCSVDYLPYESRGPPTLA